MAVVRNLMVRIGADYSSMRKEMQGATSTLNRFGRDTKRTTTTVRGRNGLGGISSELKTLGNTVTSSFSQIRGAKGIGGITSSLGTLRPIMGQATKGLGSLGFAAAGVGGSFGGAALGIGAFVAGLAVVTAGIYAASQTAAKFEADIGRLNISLREGAKGYMEWARAQGLAKQSAAELGATYGNLLGSFIAESNQLQQSTQDLVQATRIISSYTGRSLDDVFNRIRSGMLGSTEAIEDLGVYVNISMIESTEAFRRFAGDKSWAQLTFQQQQQIRLAAILEQTYKRYGNEMQQNVMTKQERLMEQLKDVKLHLSQAFLPIWDLILPALTRFSESLAYVTEQLARFFYWVRGWDYDEMTRGTDQQTDAIVDQGEAFEDLAESAKKANKELASFDEINQLGDFGGSGSGGGSGGLGSGGQTPPPIPLPGGDPSGPDWEWPKIPPELLKKYRIEFDPPRPPDAGLGAVATAVISTVNQMVADTKTKLNAWGASTTATSLGVLGNWQSMWEGLKGQTDTGLANQGVSWKGWSAELGQSIVPALSAAVSTRFANMWNNLGVQTDAGAAKQVTSWSALSNRLTQATVPSLTSSLQTQFQKLWSGLGAKTETGVVGQQTSWQSLANHLGLVTVPALSALLQTNWADMWSSMDNVTATNSLSIQQEVTGMSEGLQADISSLKNFLNPAWSGMLATMLADLITNKGQIGTEWSGLKLDLESIKVPFAAIREGWEATLTNMLTNLWTSMPSLQTGLLQIGATAVSLVPSFDDMSSSWDKALSNMKTAADQKITSMLTKMYEAISVFMTMQDVMGVASPKNALSSIGSNVKNFFGEVNKGINAIVDAGANALTFGLHNKNLQRTGNQQLVDNQQGMAGTVGSVAGSLAGGYGLAKGASSAVGKWGDDVAKWFKDMFKGLGNSIPQLATGGVVFGPTLAMIGEAGAEAVVPLEDTSFVDTLASAIGSAVVAAQQVSQSGSNEGREVVLQVDGKTIARAIVPHLDDEGDRQGTTVIKKL